MDVLKIALNLLVDKARDKLSEKLRERGSREEVLRGLVIREVAEIKESLKSLSLKDLYSAVSFLECGLIAKQNNEKEDTEEYAMNCYRSCSELATQAFCNKSLPGKDRIQAMKINITSTFLQLESKPETARDICLNHFLKELHALPSVVSSFKTFFGPGLLKFWRADEREEVVKGVIQINRAVRSFTLQKDVKVNYDQWPTIQTYKPLETYLYDSARLFEGQSLNSVRGFFSVWEVNRRRQMVRVYNKNDFIVQFFNIETGSLDAEFFRKCPEEGAIIKCLGMTLDEEDNIYLAVTKETGPFKLRGLFVEVYSPEHHYLKTITLDESKIFQYLKKIGLSKSHEKLCVVHRSDVWVYTDDNDGPMSHAIHPDMRMTDCLIHGEKIIVTDKSNKTGYVVLNESLEVERSVYIGLEVGKLVMDLSTGYLLASDEGSLIMFTECGEIIKKLPIADMMCKMVPDVTVSWDDMQAAMTIEGEIIIMVVKLGNRLQKHVKVFILQE